jgi:AcrR family transcriptional regulator
MRVFWEKGYEGTSLTDLTEAMGINRPSLYSSFGDKEALFRRALALYGEGPAAYLKAALRSARGPSGQKTRWVRDPEMFLLWTSPGS